MDAKRIEYAEKQREYLLDRSKITLSEVKDAMEYCCVEGTIEGMSHQQVLDVSYRAGDLQAEAYAAKMREGHGIGCYCGYCVM